MSLFKRVLRTGKTLATDERIQAWLRWAAGIGVLSIRGAVDEALAGVPVRAAAR